MSETNHMEGMKNILAARIQEFKHELESLIMQKKTMAMELKFVDSEPAAPETENDKCLRMEKKAELNAVMNHLDDKIN